MSHDGVHNKTMKKNNLTGRLKKVFGPGAVRVMKTVFSQNLSCVFLYDHKRDCVQSKPDQRRGRNQLGVPDLSSDGQDPTEKLGLLICTDLEQMRIIVAKKKGWVTSQWAAKRNRLLLLCTMAAGTGLKGGFVRPGGTPECRGLAAEAGMWSFWKRAGVASYTLDFGFTLALSFWPWPSHENLGAIGSSKRNLNPNPQNLQIPLFFNPMTSCIHHSNCNMCDECSLLISIPMAAPVL